MTKISQTFRKVLKATVLVASVSFGLGACTTLPPLHTNNTPLVQNDNHARQLLRGMQDQSGQTSGQNSLPPAPDIPNVVGGTRNSPTQNVGRPDQEFIDVMQRWQSALAPYRNDPDMVARLEGVDIGSVLSALPQELQHVIGAINARSLDARDMDGYQIANHMVTSAHDLAVALMSHSANTQAEEIGVRMIVSQFLAWTPDSLY